MIAKVQPSKRRSRSSFKRLLNYLTTERDATTGDTRLRGDVVLSGNLVGIDTAAAEMKALEFFNPRCHDAVFHYELAWPPGERPSRAEWTDAALGTLPVVQGELDVGQALAVSGSCRWSDEHWCRMPVKWRWIS